MGNEEGKNGVEGTFKVSPDGEEKANLTWRPQSDPPFRGSEDSIGQTDTQTDRQTDPRGVKTETGGRKPVAVGFIVHIQ